MSDNRRYNEDEITEILDLATQAQEGVGPPARGGVGPGLTLDEIKEIGSEVGIAPDRIASAVQVLESRKLAGPTRTFLGAPRSVSRIVPIERALTDHEWGRLVADLRHTFDAAGKISSSGGLHTWTNGNLHVYVEPDASGRGYQVRMRTEKGSVVPAVAVSVVLLLLSVVLVLDSIADGGDLLAQAMAMLFGVAATGNVAYTRATLPRWAAERAAQMEGLAERIPLLLEK